MPFLTLIPAPCGLFALERLRLECCQDGCVLFLSISRLHSSVLPKTAELFLTQHQHLSGLGRQNSASDTLSLLPLVGLSLTTERSNLNRRYLIISRIYVHRAMIASGSRGCSGAGVVNAGRIRTANSAIMVASIVSVLASLPMARATQARQRSSPSAPKPVSA